MLRFMSRRVLMTAFTLLMVSIIVFALARLQGDPRMVLLSDDTSKKVWDEWGRQFGLDKPIYVQYIVYLRHILTGDLGDSVLQRKPVASILWQRIPSSAQLAVGAFIFSTLIGVPLGVMAAIRRGGAVDYLARGFALIGQSMPSFWVGLVLVFLFSVTLGWLPTARRGDWTHYILPSVTLGWFAASGQLRLLRSSLLEVLDSEYVKFARAKGVPGWKIVWKHAMRNAMIAPLTFMGLTLAGFVTGSVIVETVFAWPGLGLLAVQSVYNSDYPVLQGVILLVAIVYVTTNFAVDILYAYIDPRIRFR